MKNELENDSATLGDNDDVRGLPFVSSFLSLYLYFRVLEKIRAAGFDQMSFLWMSRSFSFRSLYIVKACEWKERLNRNPQRRLKY